MNVSFEGNLDIVPVKGSKTLWRVKEPYTVYWNNEEYSYAGLEVPKDYITDFASVPRVFWNIIYPLDYDIRWIAPAHDRIYETHSYTRRFADELLYYGMRCWNLPASINSKKSIARSYLAWSGVRAGGYWAYRTGPERKKDRVKFL